MLKFLPCPKAGEGVNQWVNSHVLRMLKANYTNATIYKKLIHLAQGCGRDIRKDITHSIETGRIYLGIGRGFGIQKFDTQSNEISFIRELPPLNPEFQKQILEKNHEINIHTWPKSEHQEYNTIEVLYHLFGRNRICIGYSQNHATIDNLVKLGSVISFNNRRIRLGLCQFIVPTPMVGDYAVNKSGKYAVRCLSNTCERWFLVIEFDHLSSLDDQIRLHYELSQQCELRMLIFSGNKSIHGWYDVYRQPVRHNKKFMKTATAIGADPMTWIRCQYVRFPGGINSKTRTKQEILYYNYGK